MKIGVTGFTSQLTLEQYLGENVEGKTTTGLLSEAIRNQDIIIDTNTNPERLADKLICGIDPDGITNWFTEVCERFTRQSVTHIALASTLLEKYLPKLLDIAGELPLITMSSTLGRRMVELAQLSCGVIFPGAYLLPLAFVNNLRAQGIRVYLPQAEDNFVDHDAQILRVHSPKQVEQTATDYLMSDIWNITEQATPQALVCGTDIWFTHADGAKMLSDKWPTVARSLPLWLPNQVHLESLSTLVYRSNYGVN